MWRHCNDLFPATHVVDQPIRSHTATRFRRCELKPLILTIRSAKHNSKCSTACFISHTRVYTCPHILVFFAAQYVDVTCYYNALHVWSLNPIVTVQRFRNNDPGNVWSLTTTTRSAVYVRHVYAALSSCYETESNKLFAVPSRVHFVRPVAHVTTECFKFGRSPRGHGWRSMHG